jgi:hypothetical protein
MKVSYTVHNPHDTPISKVAVLNGEPTSVMVNGFECELRAADESHGSVKLRFFGAAATSARATFTADAVIDATFEVAAN